MTSKKWKKKKRRRVNNKKTDAARVKYTDGPEDGWTDGDLSVVVCLFSRQFNRKSDAIRYHIYAANASVYI